MNARLVQVRGFKLRKTEPQCVVSKESADQKKKKKKKKSQTSSECRVRNINGRAMLPDSTVNQNN